MNTCCVSIDFVWHDLDGEFMKVSLRHQGRQYDLAPDDRKRCTIDINMILPDVINIEFSGKGSQDTKVDEQGQIVADKCVIINQIRLDNMAVDRYWLTKTPRLVTASGHVDSNYAGFNGHMCIDFDEPDVFRLWHKWQTVGQTSRP